SGAGDQNCVPAQCAEAIPHSVRARPEPSAQCAETKLTNMQRGEMALTALEQAWRQRAEAPPSLENMRHLDDAKRLAGEFRRHVQAQHDLVGLALSSGWVRSNYARFCLFLGIEQPPPYKDFARELAHLMPRKRRWEWKAGKRVGTST